MSFKIDQSLTNIIVCWGLEENIMLTFKRSNQRVAEQFPEAILHHPKLQNWRFWNQKKDGDEIYQSEEDQVDCRSEHIMSSDPLQHDFGDSNVSSSMNMEVVLYECSSLTCIKKLLSYPIDRNTFRYQFLSFYHA